MSVDAVSALEVANACLDRIAQLMPDPFAIDPTHLPEMVEALDLAADQLGVAEAADPLVTVTHEVDGERRELDISTTGSAILAYAGLVTGFGKGDKVRGAELLAKALETAPADFANGHFALAILYADTNQYELAARHARIALDLDPENSSFRELLDAIEEDVRQVEPMASYDDSSPEPSDLRDARPAHESADAAPSFAELLKQSPQLEPKMTSSFDFESRTSSDKAIWLLTSRVRSLVQRVQRGVLDRAEQATTAAKEHLAKVRADGEASVESADRLVSTLRSSGESFEQRARNHVLAQGIETRETLFPTNKTWNSSLSDPTRVVSEGEALVDPSTQIVAEMLKIGKPRVFWRPDAERAWAGLGVGSIIAGSFVSYLFGRGFLLGAGALYAFVMWRLHQDPGGKLQEMYRQVRANAQRLREMADRCVEEVSRQARERLAAAEHEVGSALAALDQELTASFSDLAREAATLHMDSGFAGAGWEEPTWERWEPASAAAFAARIGTLSATIPAYGGLLPTLAGAISVPALIPFPEGQCLLFQASGANKHLAANAVQSGIARLLATIPPAKLRLTLIDPVALGSNVSAFMALADYEDSLVTSRAWSEPQHIEQRLADLTEHMETVIQKYLRADYQSIYDYNDAAQEVAEPYRLLVVYDFPVNFTDAAARRLVSIARNGPRCGVYTFIVRDVEKPLPYGFSMEDLEAAAAGFNALPSAPRRGLQWDDADFSRWELALDSPAPAETLSKVIAAVGARAKDAMRVEVPYDKLLSMAHINADSWWRLSTAESIRVPLGPSGARKLQHLVLGEGMSHHVLIVGRPGSGKSNLMHVIITTLALTYSPSELRLYLIDFKKGVEFKPYADARLAHAEAIAVESEREFGLSVIERIDLELKQRGDLFRAAGAANIKEFREKKPDVRMPRILLLVDEFQEFFSEDDHIGRQTALILDRLVRQGRAFGVHIVLGSQTLAGSNSLAASTLDQMAVRIAMQCSEADSRLILSDDNPAARLLSRPGEAIYNAAAGLIEGNSLFQVARFSEDDRAATLEIIAGIAKGSGELLSVPIIFEGNELAHLADGIKVRELLGKDDWPTSKVIDLFLGEPIAIRGPVAARVRQQSGSNLIIFTRDEEEGVGMCMAAILSILIQSPPHAASVIIADFTLAESEWAEHAEDMERHFPHKPRVLSRQRDVAEEVRKLAAEVKRRSSREGNEVPTSASINFPESKVYFVLQGLHRMKLLRIDDDSFEYDGSDTTRPSEYLAAILRDGPEVGIHVVAWCDTWSNATRVVENRGMSNFGLRAGGIMSADDSQKVFDNSAASRIDKPHRVLFSDDERPGQLDKFRPYAMPPKTWLVEVGGRLTARISS